MEYFLEIKQEAISDIQNAYNYYENRKSGLGEQFLNTLEEYLETIQKNPLHYQIKRNPYRETFLKIFPFVVIFEVKMNKIVVYAVFNTSKNPKKKPT